MPRNGSGIYSLPSGINPVVANTPIASNWANTTLQDLALAVTFSIAKDGQTVPTANMPMGGFRHLNVGDPLQPNQYYTAKAAREQLAVTLTNVTGTDAVSAVAFGAPASFAVGQTVQLTPANNNTGNVTLTIDSVGPLPVRRPDGSQFPSGDFKAGWPYWLVRDSTGWLASNAHVPAGTVTSVGMTVPTGLAIGGSPVTGSGTLAVTYAAGYQGYTTAESSKLSGIAAGATVGATWGTNLASIPANITSWAGIAPSAKQNALGFTPVNKAGDTMTGPLIAAGVRSTSNNFYGGGAFFVGAPDSGSGKNGAVIFRPDGDGSTTAQFVINTAGFSWNGRAGWHAGNFDPTSKLDIDNSGSNANNRLRSIGHLADPTSNTPTGSWTSLISNTDGNWGFQLAQPWFEHELYLRVLQSSMWSSWRKLWHSGNSSQVIVSSSDPGGPDGTLWVQP